MYSLTKLKLKLNNKTKITLGGLHVVVSGQVLTHLLHGWLSLLAL